MSSSTSKTLAMAPRQTIRGHSVRVEGVAHLPGGRRIITCSDDGSLRLWELESGIQVGNDWRDKGDIQGVKTIALSPNGNTIASGSYDGTVRLWDVERGKVIAKWTGHTDKVYSVCWSADGNRVVSGSRDGPTARVRDVKSGKTDNTKFATGGQYENAVKIWDAKTGEPLATLKHDWPVFSLTWTSDGKKLISASHGSIRIFYTATWEQIAILNGHTTFVNAFSLSRNNRLLASASNDSTVRLWNLDTNLSVGPPLRHGVLVKCVALSADGKVLVTGGRDKNVYTWDIDAILRLPTSTNVAPKDRFEQKASQGNSGIECTSRSSLTDKSFLEADATRCHDEFGDVDELSPRFFDGMEADDSSPTGDAHLHSSGSALLACLLSLLRRFRPDGAEANELPQPSRHLGFRALLACLVSLLHRFRPDGAEANELSQPSRPLGFRALVARLSSLIHRSPPEIDAPNEPQQPSPPSGLGLHALCARMSSLLPRSRLNTDEEAERHPTAPSGSRLDALIGRLSSIIRSQPHTNKEIELPQRPRRPHVVEVAPVRDRQVLYVAPRPQPDRPYTQPAGTTPLGATPAQSRLLRLLALLVLFLCCASPQHADGNIQPTQQQRGKSQDQVQTHATSSQAQPTAPSTSTTPTAPDIDTTAPGAAITQSRPLPLRTRLVLFLCCASLPHAD